MWVVNFFFGVTVGSPVPSENGGDMEGIKNNFFIVTTLKIIKC